jgi:hypothetical protein
MKYNVTLEGLPRSAREGDISKWHAVTLLTGSYMRNASKEDYQKYEMGLAAIFGPLVGIGCFCTS